MKVYIVEEYDYVDDEVISRKVYTKQALEKRKEDLIKQLREKERAKIDQENKEYNETLIERNLLNSELLRLNQAVEKAKLNGDDAQYRHLRRERRKVAHRIDGIANEHNCKLHSINRECENAIRDVMRNCGFIGARIEEIELVV